MVCFTNLRIPDSLQARVQHACLGLPAGISNVKNVTGGDLGIMQCEVTIRFLSDTKHVAGVTMSQSLVVVNRHKATPAS